jgi:hypothetical protein
MRRMRNRILLSGVAALMSAAVIAGPAAASTSSHDYDPCDRRCGGGDYDRPRHDKDCDIYILGLRICLKLKIG